MKESLYFYRVGYGSYEDSGVIAITHEKKFTNAEFENMILEVVPGILERKHKKEMKKWEEVDYREDEDPEYKRVEREVWALNVRFEEIYPLIGKALCRKFGFKPVKYKADYFVWGWADYMAENPGWNRDMGKKCLRLHKHIRESLPSMAARYDELTKKCEKMQHERYEAEREKERLEKAADEHDAMKIS